VIRLRAGIRAHRDIGLVLCWHHPQLWGLLLEPIPRNLAVPDWPQLLWKALATQSGSAPPPSRVAPLGLVGGLLDSIGGGGWGPIVTSTLLGQGTTPRYAIGSVNLAEFFVTATISATFLLTIGLALWPIIAGLVLGGVLAAITTTQPTMIISALSGRCFVT
jgi:uncharacterized membrane protein YfcA